MCVQVNLKIGITEMNIMQPGGYRDPSILEIVSLIKKDNKNYIYRSLPLAPPTNLFLMTHVAMIF